MSGAETCIGNHCVGDDTLGPILFVWCLLAFLFVFVPLYAYCLNWWIGLFKREDE